MPYAPARSESTSSDSASSDSARPVLSGALLLLGLFAFGCATGGGAEQPVYKSYQLLDDTMVDEIEPLVEKLMTRELAKDPEATDYATIAADAKKAAYYFGCATESGHSMYLRKKKDRASAGEARDWFAAIANAAGLRQHQKLVQLYGQKQKICSLCHEY